MDKDQIKEDQSQGDSNGDQEKQNPRYYQIDGSQKKKKNHLKTALIIIGSILLAIILLGVGCTQITANFFDNLVNIGGTATYEEEINLPADDFIAQISVEGTIQSSNQDNFGLTYGYQHQWTLDLIDNLIDNNKNKGLIIWVDSPGGTIYESDELYLAILKYKEKTERPVYAIMGSMAASGGYYISAPADKIIANRNTWTGSIGVTLGTFIDVSDLLEKYGVKTTTITSGRNKAMGSQFETMTQEQMQIFKDLIDESYQQFVDIVATNRQLSKSEVIKLADGRIYTAKQALDLGLIDQINTLEEGILDFQESYGLEYCDVEDFRYIQTSWLAGILGEITEFSVTLKSSDLDVLEKLMDSNEELKPMYIYEK